MVALVDRTNQRHGRLLITRRAERPEHIHKTGAWWYADCDCGTKDYRVSGDSLRRTRSCGCLQKEHAASVWRRKCETPT